MTHLKLDQILDLLLQYWTYSDLLHPNWTHLFEDEKVKNNHAEIVHN